MVIVVQQSILKMIYKTTIEAKKMMIVGQISSPEEAKEMEFIVKMLVVGNRARVIAERTKTKG
jgi:hypothetical protein